MTGIPSLPSRSVLACAISSAVLVVVSVYWFRKKRKIKELPVLGPSEKPDVCIPALENLAEGVTDVELAAVSEETSVKTTYSIPVKTMYSIPEIDDTMQVKDFIHSVSDTDISAQPTCHDYAMQNNVDVLENSFDEEVMSRASISGSSSVPENFSAGSIVDHSEHKDNKCSDLTEGSCSSVTCSEPSVCDRIEVDEVSSSTNSAVEVQQLRDLLKEVHLISDNSNLQKEEEITDGDDMMIINLSDSSSSRSVTQNCEAVQRLDSRSPETEILACKEAVDTVGQSESSLSNLTPFPESSSGSETYLPQLSCSSELSDSECSIEVSEPVSFTETRINLECCAEMEEQTVTADVVAEQTIMADGVVAGQTVMADDVVAEQTIMADDVVAEQTITADDVVAEQTLAADDVVAEQTLAAGDVVAEFRNSENVVEENGENVLDCEGESKITNLNNEKPKECVMECITDLSIGSKEVENHNDLLNGSHDCSYNEDDLTIGSLPDENIPNTENITARGGSIDCSELCSEPLSPAPEWIPEDKSRSSVTVSSSVSFSDSAPLSPTLTVDEEFTSLDDASKGASSESEKLRTCESMDSNKSSVTKLLSSERFERDHLDNIIVPSENLVTDLESFSGVSSPQPDITASISNGNLNIGLHSIESQLSSSPLRNTNHSEVRNEVHVSGTLDSGKIGDANALIDIKPSLNTSNYHIYEFELPQELCGRLIGKQGKYVKYIKERSNCNVLIKRHPFNHQLKLVVVEGTRSDVNNALELIRKKFPPSQFQNVSLAQTHILGSLGVPAVPESSQLHIPDGGVSCDVILSSLVTAGHFFLQQPTHPTYPSLSTLDQCMMACYSQMETPRLPQPVEAGVICAATIMNGWYRAQIVYVYESGEECDIKFVDYGGFSQVPVSSLRQIRSDFMALPFQASECYLANVVPQNEELGWTPDASAAFEELAQGQILQTIVVSYAEDGIPYVELYRVQGISSTFINQELVNLGVAKWVASH